MESVNYPDLRARQHGDPMAIQWQAFRQLLGTLLPPGSCPPASPTHLPDTRKKPLRFVIMGVMVEVREMGGQAGRLLSLTQKKCHTRKMSQPEETLATLMQLLNNATSGLGHELAVAIMGHLEPPAIGPNPARLRMVVKDPSSLV
jgi:hypothetical protein